MSYHSGTIHTVRFSPGGKFLASGADDKIVCIYTLDPSPPTHATFGKLGALVHSCWTRATDTLRRLQRGTSCRELAHLPTTHWTRQRRPRSRLVIRWNNPGFRWTRLQSGGVVWLHV